MEKCGISVRDKLQNIKNSFKSYQHQESNWTFLVKTFPYIKEWEGLTLPTDRISCLILKRFNNF